MKTEIYDAAARLTEMLEAENAALAVLDLARATGLVSEKEDAVSRFLACAAAFTSAAEAPRSAELEELGRRLSAASAENHRLLERAIAVQSRVIAIVARAAPRAAGAEPARYGAFGRTVPGLHPGARAFCFRA